MCVQGVCALGEVEQVMFVVCVCTGRVCSGGGGAGDVCCVCVQGGCTLGEVELVMFVVCVYREGVLWGRWSW